MGILDNLEPPVRKRTCFVAEKAATLDKKDAEILLAAAVNPEWAIIPLTHALNERGVNLTRSMLERHRKGMCPCSKI